MMDFFSDEDSSEDVYFLAGECRYGCNKLSHFRSCFSESGLRLRPVACGQRVYFSLCAFEAESSLRVCCSGLRVAVPRQAHFTLRLQK